MIPRRFFSRQIEGKTAIIEGDDHFHFTKVLRGSPGDTVILFNGAGVEAKAVIKDIKKKYSTAEITSTKTLKRPDPGLVICPSLLKKREMDIMIEKLSEMGVDEIRPVIFTRTDIKFREGSLKRWDRITLESLKVNDKLWRTRIFPPFPLDKIITDSEHFESKIMFDISGNILKKDIREHVIGIIGPPGDFTDKERKLLTNSGFFRLNINDAIMKVETAAISAAAIVKYLRMAGK